MKGVIVVKSPPVVDLDVEGLFRKIIAGEPWANRISYESDDQCLSPHLAYSSKSRVGCIRFPPQNNLLKIAAVFAHEGGHLEEFDLNPPKRLAIIIESFICSEKYPPFIKVIVRMVYFLVFWRKKMKRELYAHQVAVRLLKKIGLMQAIFYLNNDVEGAILKWPWYEVVVHCFNVRLKKAQDKITQTAQSMA